MTTEEEAARLLAACAFLGAHEAERRLLHAEVTKVELFLSATADTYTYHFRDGTMGAFKSIEGADRPITRQYGHTPASALLNDVAAWLVARALGFDHLIQGVVITTCSHENAGLGSLQRWLAGEPSGDGWQGSSHVREAALLDALIGHQDRNASNFKYDGDADELGLYDNSFAFALQGHQTSASVILHAAYADDATLDQPLVDALDGFDQAAMEREALGRILAPDRWQGVLGRAAEMRRRGRLLGPLEF